MVLLASLRLRDRVLNKSDRTLHQQSAFRRCAEYSPRSLSSVWRDAHAIRALAYRAGGAEAVGPGTDARGTAGEVLAQGALDRPFRPVLAGMVVIPARLVAGAEQQQPDNQDGADGS